MTRFWRAAMGTVWLGAFFAVLIAALIATGAPAFAVRPDEMLKDPVLEHRARVISKELRCLVCQDENIDDSQADLAHDLRVLVRKRLVAGDTNQQVIDYIHARYGDFVLLDPPVKKVTLLLWFGPLAVLLLGGAGIAFYYRRRHKLAAAPAPLTPEEKKRLGKLLGGGPIP